MFDTRKQSIPQCFIDKMNADKEVEALKKQKIVDFYVTKKATLMQRTYRQRCIMAISKNAGPIIDGGSAGSGSNYVPPLASGVAA